jgi:hypothetical protein
VGPDLYLQWVHAWPLLSSIRHGEQACPLPYPNHSTATTPRSKNVPFKPIAQHAGAQPAPISPRKGVQRARAGGVPTWSLITITLHKRKFANRGPTHPPAPLTVLTKKAA